jgi:chemotaxis protein CheD
MPDARRIAKPDSLSADQPEALVGIPHKTQNGPGFVDVPTGEVAARRGAAVLQASAIGSCVVVAAFDRASRVGGMAHAMLPGSAPRGQSVCKTKYAEDAVTELVRMMAGLGADATRTETCLVGGGDIVGDGAGLGDGIARSVTEALRREGMAPVAAEVGGTQRRSCSLDVASGRVTYTVGDSGHQTLWKVGGE